MNNKNWWQSLEKGTREVVVVLIIFLSAVGLISYVHGRPRQSAPTSPLTPLISQGAQPTSQAKPYYTGINSEINAIRKASGLSNLSDNTALDDAAKARADEMVANNIRDNISGDTASHLRTGDKAPFTNYVGGPWSLQSTWDNPTAEQAAGAITKKQSFALGDGYTSIGSGASSYDNGNKILVVVYLGNSPYSPTDTTDCTPWTNSGTCYEPGEYCRESDHGVSGTAGDGETITCTDNSGWRWERS
jgi:hypothetical protein